MNNDSSAVSPVYWSRIESIDILRGMIIVLMVFVNDVSGVENVPAWLRHVSATTRSLSGSCAPLFSPCR